MYIATEVNSTSTPKALEMSPKIMKDNPLKIKKTVEHRKRNAVISDA